MSAPRQPAVPTRMTSGKLHAALSGERSGGQQQRRGGNGQATLLDQHPAKEQGIAVLHHELERLSHAIARENYPESLDALAPQEGSAWAKYIVDAGADAGESLEQIQAGTESSLCR